MELVNIKLLRNSPRKIISTYALTDEMYNYYGAYSYLNIAKVVNDPMQIVIDANNKAMNADEFNPIRYGIT